MKNWYQTEIKNLKQAAKDGISWLDLAQQNVGIVANAIEQ